MIRLSQRDYSQIRRGGIWYIVGNDKACCPICGGVLRVRGVCRRKIRTFGNVSIVQLRVLICKKCGKTHRELPHFLVPYNRYCLRCIMGILTSPEERCQCEISTRVRMHNWWIILRTRVEHIAQKDQGRRTTGEYTHVSN